MAYRDIVLSVITRLKVDTTVSGTVGTRVYRNHFPVGTTFPAIVVARISAIHTNDTDTGAYETSRIQCTVYTADDGSADKLSEDVANALHRVTNTYWSSVYVIECVDAGARPGYDATGDLYSYHRDFTIQYLAR